MSTEITPRKDCYQLRKAGYEMADACELCGSVENLVIDHIMPLSQGGSNDTANLRTLCNSCNTKEGWKYRERPCLSKYTTHLRPASIEAIRDYAYHHKMKDYEVVQAAIDEYLEKHNE